MPAEPTISDKFRIYILPADHEYFPDVTPLYLGTENAFGSKEDAGEFVIIYNETTTTSLARFSDTGEEFSQYTYAGLSLTLLKSNYFASVYFDNDYCDINDLEYPTVPAGEWYLDEYDEPGYTKLRFYNKDWVLFKTGRKERGDAVWCYANLEVKEHTFEPKGYLRAFTNTAFGKSCEQVHAYVSYIKDGKVMDVDPHAPPAEKKENSGGRASPPSGSDGQSLSEHGNQPDNEFPPEDANKPGNASQPADGSTPDNGTENTPEEGSPQGNGTSARALPPTLKFRRSKFASR